TACSNLHQSTKTKVWEHTHVSFSRKNLRLKQKDIRLLATSVKLELVTSTRLHSSSAAASHPLLHLKVQRKLSSSNSIKLLAEKRPVIHVRVLFSCQKTENYRKLPRMATKI